MVNDMSLKVMLQDYIEHQRVIETDFYGYILQYRKKYNNINIKADKGIDVKVFTTIKKRFKNIDDELMIDVNRW